MIASQKQGENKLWFTFLEKLNCAFVFGIHSVV